MRTIHLLATALLAMAPVLARAQNVGINADGSAPHASAMLDIDVSALPGTKTGLLVPRMTSAQRNAIPAPATGLLVYDTTLDAFWYFNGTAWVSLLHATTGWRTTGNDGTVDGTHFIGTTDNVAFSFRVDDVAAGRIGHTDLNTFLGYGSGLSATTGTANVAMGHDALGSLTTGGQNVAVGRGALATHTNPTGIVAIGDSALGRFVGAWSTAVGWHALKNCTSGFSNTAIGMNSLWQTTTGYSNTSIGTDCMNNNTTGFMNSVLGYFTLMSNTEGHRNVAIGTYAGRSNTIGDRNTFVGHAAGELNTTGLRNTFVGYHAGSQAATGSYNTFIGAVAGYMAAGLERATAIGYNAQVTANNSLVLGGTGVDAVHVGIGVTAPAAELEVNGYTKLGPDAPAVRMVVITGTTAATAAGSAAVPHGVNAAKILAVDLHVEYSPNNWVPQAYTVAPGYQYNYYYTATNLIVRNVAGNSATILAKPFKALITYEE